MRIFSGRDAPEAGDCVAPVMSEPTCGDCALKRVPPPVGTVSVLLLFAGWCFQPQCLRHRQPGSDRRKPAGDVVSKPGARCLPGKRRNRSRRFEVVQFPCTVIVAFIPGCNSQ